MAEILKRIEGHVGIELLVVGAVASFDFPIVAGRPGPDQAVADAQFPTKRPEWMVSLHGLPVGMDELKAVVGLDLFRYITEEVDGAYEKVAAVEGSEFLIPIEESSAGAFVDQRVLVELFVEEAGSFAFTWDLLGVDLPFYADVLGRIVEFGL